MLEPLIQPVVNLMGLAAIVFCACMVPVMLSALMIKQIFWWGLGDSE